GPGREDTAEGNIVVDLEWAPFRREDVQERAAGLQYPVDLPIGQLRIHDMLEDRAGGNEIKGVIGPRDPGHRPPAAWTARHRVKTEMLEIGGRSQIDVVLHLVAERVAKSGI